MGKPLILSFLILIFLVPNCTQVGYNPPNANDQSVSLDEDSSISITLTASVYDENSVTWEILEGPFHGSIAGTLPVITYTPQQDYNGSDFFKFLADDWYHESEIATVTITVNPVNDPPSSTSASILTMENTPSTGVTPTVNDVDNDESFSFTILTQPSTGVAYIISDQLYYEPKKNVNGSDSFTYRAFDSGMEYVDGVAEVTILSVDFPPVADSQSVVVDEDIGEPILLTGSDPDGDELTYVIVSQPSNGTLSGTPPSVTYLSNPDYYGEDSFTFQVNDGSYDSNVATVNITVNPVDDAPVAHSQSVTADEDVPQPILLTGNDPEGNELTYIIVSQPSNGTLTGSPPELTYLSALNYHGNDSFTFQVNDGSSDSAVATVNITVNPVNDAPVAHSQSVTADKDVPQSIVLTGSDPDGDELTYVIVSQPSNGTLSGDPPNITYLSHPDYTGTDTFSFRVNDGSVDSVEATVTVTVYLRIGIWFVDGDATGTGDGRSWVNAFPHPQNGIDMAIAGEDVWVAAGIYSSMDTVGSMPVLAMKEGVNVYGGFAGSETLFSERDLASNPTFLDGEYLVDNVVVGASDAILDGFVITGGHTESLMGAGMVNEDVTGLRVLNSVFSGNETVSTEGGGMYNSSAELEIGNCVFTGNSASRGGAINSRNSTVYIVNTTIVSNTAASQGGGIYNRNGLTSLVNSIVYDNAPNQILDGGNGETVVTYSDIQQDGYAGTNGNINAEPVFSDSDYHLDSSSPCIDAGDNTAVMASLYDYDLDGNDRIIDGDGEGTATVDIGAYEYVP